MASGAGGSSDAMPRLVIEGKGASRPESSQMPRVWRSSRSASSWATS